jgi:membrane-associated phospholipid phosphatase
VVDIWRHPSARLCLAIVALLAAVDALLLVRSGIVLTAGSWSGPLTVVTMAAIAAGVASAILLRLTHDESGPARLLKPAARRIRDLSLASAMLTVYSAVAALGSYLVITLAFPFQDDAYAAIDSALGLDWMAWLAWANGNPPIAAILAWSYSVTLQQIFCVLVFLAMTGRSQRLWDFVALLAVCGVFTLAISCLAPAVAPFAYYKPDPSLYDILDARLPGIGRAFISETMALHSGAFREFDLRKVDGLVVFPSYHTVMGLVSIYALRDVRYAVWPVAAVSLVMIVSTIPVGGHYFVDVIGGAAVTLAAIAIVDRVNGRAPVWRRAAARLGSVARPAYTWGKPVVLPSGRS